MSRALLKKPENRVRLFLHQSGVVADVGLVSPIGLTTKRHACAICGIECKAGKKAHYRCLAQVEREEQRTLGRFVAEQVWGAL